MESLKKEVKKAESMEGDVRKKVLCINICNDVYHSVAVNSLAKDNKYGKFCFGPHVSSNSTKDAIPLVVYNNTDDHTLSLDDVTLSNVLSKNPRPMTGPLFYRKSKAEFKELSENEIAELRVKSVEEMSSSNGGQESNDARARDADVGQTEPAQEDLHVLEKNEMMTYLEGKDMTGLLLDSTQISLIESTLSSDQAMDILGPGMLGLYDAAGLGPSPASAQASVLRDHSYALKGAPPLTAPNVPMTPETGRYHPFPGDSSASLPDKSSEESSESCKQTPGTVDKVSETSEESSPLVPLNKPQRKLTEAMFNEKLRQALPDDSDDYQEEDPFGDESPSPKWSQASPKSESSPDLVQPGQRKRNYPEPLEVNCIPRKSTKRESKHVASASGAKLAKKALGENREASGKDVKPAWNVTKSYPKRENRRPPGRLKDALQPPLFSAPDVIRRFSSENKMAVLTDEGIAKILNEDTSSEGELRLSQESQQSTELPSSSEGPVTSGEASSDYSGKLVIVEGEDKSDSTMEEDSPIAVRPASPLIKSSKRIRVAKRIFTELEDQKPSPRAPKSKVSKAVEGKGSERKEASNDSDSSNANSEDDPNKLWCICRKPHNNRFMICCDKCEEWFHGQCVNITKSMGKTMEVAGEEWTCPKCEKKPVSPRKEVAKLSPKKKPDKAAAGRLKASKHTQLLLGALSRTNSPRAVEPKSKPPEKSPSKEMLCILCKSKTRPNSIYCSDDCILNHADHNLSSRKADGSDVTDTAKKGTLPTKAVGVKEKDEKDVSAHLAVKSKRVKKDSPKLVFRASGEVAYKSKLVTIKKAVPQVTSPAPLLQRKPKEEKKKVASKVLTSPNMVVKTKVTAGPKVSVKSTKKVDVTLKVETEKPKESEPIRVNVRKTLHSLLLARIQECVDLKSISEEEVQKIGYDIEEELYALFKETGSKYKSKYRSLVFNIRDPTNLTLFRKIAEKLVTPTQLVRLSPEELASQQLAQWRQQESKHQLEMIKKNELDLMALSKTVVMKTHKGEQIIENDDVQKETVLDFGIDNSDSLNQGSVSSTVPDRSLEVLPSSGSSRSMSSSHSSSKRSREHKTKRSREHERKKDSRSSSRREKEKEKEKSRRKSSHRDKHQSLEKKSVQSKDLDKAHETIKSEDKTVSATDVESTETSVWSESIVKGEEPSSTVPDIKNSPQRDLVSPIAGTLWTGCVYMPDIVKFVGSVHMVSGNFPKGCSDFPATLDIVGRIQPKQVWPYISKMKRSGTKEISVIRFSPLDEDEMSRYVLLHTYLNSRERLGVAGNLPKSMKDLYILPLPPHSPLPEVLLPLTGPGLEDNRPEHLLLGIIVRHRSAESATSERSYTPPLGERSHTPTVPSARSGKQTKKVKVVREKAKPVARKEEDEPYSPGDIGDLTDPGLDLQKTMDELNRKIAREKEEIESMLAGPSEAPIDEAYSPSASFTPPHKPTYQPLEPTTSMLANLSTNISLPSNLQEILANVKKQNKSSIKSDPIVQNYSARKAEQRSGKSYVPTSKSRDPRSHEAAKATSTLSKLSDADLIKKAAMEMGVETTAALYNQPLPPGTDVPVMTSYPGFQAGSYDHPLEMMPYMAVGMPPPGYPPYALSYGVPPPNYMGPPPNMGYGQAYGVGPPDMVSEGPRGNMVSEGPRGNWDHRMEPGNSRRLNRPRGNLRHRRQSPLSRRRQGRSPDDDSRQRRSGGNERRKRGKKDLPVGSEAS